MLITLCGAKQARIGSSFVHLGLTKQCLGCDLVHFCQGKLQDGRVYVVVGLRQKTFSCALHEGGVRVVEVEEATIEATLPVRSAMEGAIVQYERQECERMTCLSSVECRPTGLLNGDKCRVLKLLDRVVCIEGKQLRRALLLRAS